MRRRKVIRLARDLIALVDGRRTPRVTPLDDLTLLLDQLAVAFDEATGPDHACGTDHTQRSYDDVRALVAARFPEFGFYNIPSRIHEDIAAAPIEVGDAVDDLADIVRELEEVVACADVHGVKTALSQLRFAVRFHIGAHLADLRWAIAHLGR